MKQTLKYSMFVKTLEIWLLFIFQQLFKHCILENIVCSIVLVPIRVTSIVWRDDNWVTLHNSWTALNPSTLSSVYRPGALGADFGAGGGSVFLAGCVCFLYSPVTEQCLPQSVVIGRKSFPFKLVTCVTKKRKLCLWKYWRNISFDETENVRTFAAILYFQIGFYATP